MIRSVVRIKSVRLESVDSKQHKKSLMIQKKPLPPLEAVPRSWVLKTSSMKNFEMFNLRAGWTQKTKRHKKVIRFFCLLRFLVFLFRLFILLVSFIRFFGVV